MAVRNAFYAQSGGVHRGDQRLGLWPAANRSATSSEDRQFSRTGVETVEAGHSGKTETKSSRNDRLLGLDDRSRELIALEVR
jgi:hypothetical protein